VETWTNSRSCAPGAIGDGLNVAWRQGFHKGASSGNTHFGMAEFVTPDESYLRDRVHFARIYGEPQDFGLLGRQDYAFLKHTKLASGTHRFEVRTWKNTGAGATKLVVDGNKYCNMMGHPDGRMDYVWVLSKGDMTIYPNAGKSSVAGGSSFWGPSAKIFTPPRNMDRKDLHLVDWDGDGACDIVWTNPDDKHRVSVWLNRFPATGRWEWQALGTPARAAAVQCSHSKGLGIHDCESVLLITTKFFLHHFLPSPFPRSSSSQAWAERSGQRG
jgi:hypothetical protein